MFYFEIHDSAVFATLMRPHLLCFQVARQIEGDTLSFHTEVISSYTGVQTVF